MNSENIVPVFTLIGTIVGAGISAFIISIYSWKRVKKQMFNNATIDFRQAFIPFIQELNKPIVKDSTMPSMFIEKSVPIREYIEKNILGHHAAMLKFFQFIKTKDRAAFTKAWNEYYQPDKDKSPDSPRVSYLLNEKETKEIILKRINILLEFAEFK